MPTGLFGPIEVEESKIQRVLTLNGQVQGGAYLQPSAKIIDPALEGPGPLSSSRYALGWLIAGWNHPQATMLMVGLGSGAGATQLLWLFPQVDLIICEIDPQIIATAEQAFPLLTYYQNRGRLQIVPMAIEDFLARTSDHWQAALVDAYTGESNALETHYLDELADRCGELYLNVIGQQGKPPLTTIYNQLARLDMPVLSSFRCAPPGAPHALSNWILCTDRQDLQALRDWDPFADFAGHGPTQLRQAWTDLLAQAAQAPTF